jgi:hypothetical protein
MKKFTVSLLLVFIILILDAQNCDLSWNQPLVYSKNFLSFLETNLNEDELFRNEMNSLSEDQSDMTFALSSLSCFQQAVKNFFSPHDRSNFLYYKTPPESMLKLNIVAGYDRFLSGQYDYSFLHYGTIFSGYISRRLFFYGFWWSGQFSGDNDEAENSFITDSWFKYSEDDNLIFMDNISGRLTYRGKGDFWSLSLGRGKYQIGSNINGSIILNNNCNDYGYISSKIDLNKFYVSFLHASLIPDSTNVSNDNIFADKYLAIHKFGWTPTENFELFWGEEVIYANRSIDVNYLIPQVFWRAVEHNLNDRDNALIFMGMNWSPVEDHILYFNFLLDEFKRSEIFSNWWGNKYAFQLGGSFLFSKLHEGSFNLEFTAVRPWLYTHFILENKFSHSDRPLGFPDGSNLIQFSSEFNYNIRRNLNLNVKTSYTRQGSVGNSYTINYNSRPSDKADWLEGDITDNFKISPILTWQFMYHHNLKAGLLVSSESSDVIDETNTVFHLSYQVIY